MATATKKAHAGHARVKRGAPATALEFLIYRDNGGRYRWEIVDGSGDSLAQSGIFTSQDDAERAARYVFDGAGSARFEPAVPQEPRTSV